MLKQPGEHRVNRARWSRFGPLGLLVMLTIAGIGLTVSEAAGQADYTAPLVPDRAESEPLTGPSAPVASATEQERAQASTTVRDVVPTLNQQGDAVPSMIPTPNSGAPPQRASDRGGTLQLAVLVVMALSVACMALWVRRSGQQNRVAARQGK